MKDTGPEAMPPVEATNSPAGRKREKENPVPPPVRCTSAISRRVPKMDSMLSSTGKTKQAASCPSGVPAFMSVGELGRKSREVSISRKRASQCRAAAAEPWISSASEMARATRSKS